MCGDYVLHVFSIVPGSLAAIGILIVLVSYTSQATCKRNGEIYCCFYGQSIYAQMKQKFVVSTLYLTHLFWTT